MKCLNFFIFSILVSQLYFCSIKCLNFFEFFYFCASTLFLFNQVFKLLIFVQSKCFLINKNLLRYLNKEKLNSNGIPPLSK